MTEEEERAKRLSREVTVPLGDAWEERGPAGRLLLTERGEKGEST